MKVAWVESGLTAVFGIAGMVWLWAGITAAASTRAAKALRKGISDRKTVTGPVKPKPCGLPRGDKSKKPGSLRAFCSDFRTPLKHLGQEVDLLPEKGVFHNQGLAAAAGMQHRGVIAAPEAPPDFGQGAGGELARQIHRHLARPGHPAGALGRVE